MAIGSSLRRPGRPPVAAPRPRTGAHRTPIAAHVSRRAEPKAGMWALTDATAPCPVVVQQRLLGATAKGRVTHRPSPFLPSLNRQGSPPCLAIVTVSKAAATARAAESQILQGPIVTAGIHDRLQVRRILLTTLSPSLCRGRDTRQPARSTASTSAAENSERICLSVDMANTLLHPDLFDDAEWRRKPSPASTRWQRDTRP